MFTSSVLGSFLVEGHVRCFYSAMKMMWICNKCFEALILLQKQSLVMRCLCFLISTSVYHRSKSNNQYDNHFHLIKDTAALEIWITSLYQKLKRHIFLTPVADSFNYLQVNSVAFLSFNILKLDNFLGLAFILKIGNIFFMYLVFSKCKVHSFLRSQLMRLELLV